MKILGQSREGKKFTHERRMMGYENFWLENKNECNRVGKVRMSIRQMMGC